MTFGYLRAFAWKHVWSWIRRKHPKNNWKELRRCYCVGGWWPSDNGVRLAGVSGRPGAWRCESLSNLDAGLVSAMSAIVIAAPPQ
ncbi:hypothetical protein GCM10010399_35280 [Dactylosporangium fulvum]|uniref:Uncharacterized protein n=1 Tax=Dactylosporangium fulvum TaxID=53359 RepID=A0ABY5VZ26_9ACTN|nr:hypothetical protein Dfulv_46315 [Dactylosporangium fulvum]